MFWMAIRFGLPGGRETDIVSLSHHGFIVHFPLCEAAPTLCRSRAASNPSASFIHRIDEIL
jgi:hypothetical protein